MYTTKSKEELLEAKIESLSFYERILRERVDQFPDMLQEEYEGLREDLDMLP